VQANQAMITQLITNLELAKIMLGKETLLIQIIDTPILSPKKITFEKLKGIIAEAFLLVFLTVAIIFFNKIYKKILE
jgi:hypothetical protein